MKTLWFGLGPFPLWILQEFYQCRVQGFRAPQNSPSGGAAGGYRVLKQAALTHGRITTTATLIS